MIFLLSSTGIIIFESHCLCTDNETVSIYVTPESCDENQHFHHSHNEANIEIETHDNMCVDCSSHMQDCGCSEPDVKYIKLINQLINDDVKYVVFAPQIFTAGYATNLLLSDNLFEKEEAENYIDPPPLIKSSIDLLIQINQLKIPELA